MVVSSVLKIYYRVGRAKKPVFENLTQSKHPINGSMITIIILF